MEKNEGKREKGCSSKDLSDKSINVYRFHDFLGLGRKRNHENDLELSLGLPISDRYGEDPKRVKISNHSSSSSTINVEVVKENEDSGKFFLSSGGSQGSGSSRMIDLGKQQPFQLGPGGSTKARRGPASGQSREHGHELVETALRTSNEKSPVSSGTIGNAAKEVALRNLMLKMPSVSTKGENGEKVEGFLHLHKNEGAEMKIVCVCHGNFMTPAEFVKHAGGADVENPLRHIIISPKPL